MIGFRKVLKLTNVLILSQARAKRGKPLKRFVRRPSAILVADILTFIFALLIMYELVSTSPSNLIHSLIEVLAPQSLVSLPVVIFSLMVLLGSLGEIAVSTGFTSSDAVNWLPITPLEYVFASSLSVFYTYSILLSAGLGVTLLLALKLGLATLWVISAVLSILAAYAGSLIVEIVRSFISRVEKLTMIGRILTLMITLVVVTLVFNPIFMLMVLQQLVNLIHSFWFAPLFWPSLLLIKCLEGDMVQMVEAGILNVVLLISLLLASVGLRRRFWVSKPRVRMKPTYTVKKDLLNDMLTRFRFTPAQIAIVRKDLRSLARRREVARFLAVPIVIVLPMLITIGSVAWIEPFIFQQSIMLLTAYMILIIGLITLTLLLSMISIGQEGKKVWNIYLAPIGDKEFLRAKLGTILFVSLPVAFVSPLILVILLYPRFDFLFTLPVLAIFPVIEAANYGLAIGCSSPDFTESPRSRFVRISEAPLMVILTALSLLVTIAPFILYISLPSVMEACGLSLISIMGITLTSSIALSLTSYKIASSAAKLSLIHI